MKAKTISEPVQRVTLALLECLSSVSIAHPMTPSLAARLRSRAHAARGLYSSKLPAASCASRVSSKVNAKDLPYTATYSCFLRILYPPGWMARIGSARPEARN